MAKMSIFLLAVIAAVVSAETEIKDAELTEEQLAAPDHAETVSVQHDEALGQQYHDPDTKEDASATGDEEVNHVELTEEEIAAFEALHNDELADPEHVSAKHEEGGASATEDEEEYTCAMPAVGSVHSYLQQFDGFSLAYFDGRGLAEVARTLFATAGRFPGHGYEDVRLSREEFEYMKASGDLEQNLNRLPILHHNNLILGQSSAINQYLAQLFGLMGTSIAEAAQIQAMVAHADDIKAAYRKIVPYGTNMTDEQADIWFDTQPRPALEKRAERQLRWFLEHIEYILPEDGYCVGNRPSLADAYFFNLLGETAPELGSKGEPFGSLTRTEAVLHEYPKLQHIVDTFKHSPGVSEYLAQRPESKF